jgi:hypothetical protein
LCNKIRKEQAWFIQWITKGKTIEELASKSKYSESKIKRIIYYWLAKEPPKLTIDYSSIKHVMIDATYFTKRKKKAKTERKKEGTMKTCLIAIMDYNSKKPIFWEVIKKEDGDSVKKVLDHLRNIGLNPLSFTTDGLPATIKEIFDIYRNVILQRCLTHIKRQSYSWLRIYPKNDMGKELKRIVNAIMEIKSEEERDAFIDRYFKWFNANKEFIEARKNDSDADRDLKRTTSLINNAISNTFHYINNRGVPNTTNPLEGFFGHLKHNYRCHTGLSKKHKISFLKWYCYLKSI